MKKFAMLLVAATVLGSTAFAGGDDGALGLGIITQSKSDAIVSKNLRFEGFFDIGTQVAGPLHVGFEAAGDLQKLDQTSFDIQQTDATIIGLGGGNAIAFITTHNLNQTYTLWDLDFSPRLYASIDIAETAQLLGFLGLNYNWQSLDYKASGGVGMANEEIGTSGKYLDSSGNYSDTQNSDGTWTTVAGLRFTFSFIYLDYTRFLQANNAGDYTWNQYNKDRFGFGVNFRF